jgi:hypothetical protein
VVCALALVAILLTERTPWIRNLYVKTNNGSKE